LAVNNRASGIQPAKEKDTARTICICITVISFVLLTLVVAMPSMYEKYNEQAEKEALFRAESKVPGKDETLSLVYTVQAGSFDDLQSAKKLYDYITNDLTTKDLAYLRIEKVGQYYAVRIGKFGERSHAEIFHEKIRLQLSTAIIMQAYIKEERMKKLHSS
jgi:hypothetical protein